ncbi:FUSC family protein, partial [Francisella philomiragia]
MSKSILEKIDLFLNTDAIIYALKGVIASFLALYIAMSFNLEKPIWAFLTAIFLHTRPETGFIVQKGTLKILITIIATVISTFILGTLLPYPSLAIAVLALYMAIMTVFSSNLTNPNFVYAFTMANVTCVIIVFEVMGNASSVTNFSIFKILHARLIEIFIGTACASFVNYYIFPKKLVRKINADSKSCFEVAINLVNNILDKDNLKYSENIQSVLTKLVTIDNNLTGAKYEKINTSLYYDFIYKIIDLIKETYILKKEIESTNNTLNINNLKEFINAYIKKATDNSQ